MNDTLVVQLAALRAAVGYLGEKAQNGWWSSSFFAPGSSAFLSPVFRRTQIVAQCVGVVAAASRVHDERIGVGHVYHLFRLPEDIEQAVHRALHQPDTGKLVAQCVTGPEAAMSFLRQVGSEQPDDVVGPTRIADIDGVRDPQTWELAAVTYAGGFEQGREVYPYVADRK